MYLTEFFQMAKSVPSVAKLPHGDAQFFPASLPASIFRQIDAGSAGARQYPPKFRKVLSFRLGSELTG